MPAGELIHRRRRAVEWLELMWSAVRGRATDPTTGPLDRAIVLLAVPMVLEMAMESIFAVVDIFFVSRLGADATAAVGLTESLFTIVYTVGIGLSIGVTAIVARRIGEKNEEAAARVTFQAIVLGTGVSLLLGVIGVWQVEALLRLMGASADVIDIGAGYARVMFAGNAAVLLLFMLNAAFRGAGDAAIAMRVLWIANGINIVLDPLLIFGIGPFPEMGVTGAAVATTIGRSIGVLLQLWVLLRGHGVIHLTRRAASVSLRLIAQLLRLSGAGMLQVFVAVASWILLVRIVAAFGSEAVAGYTVAIRIVLFALLPASGLANAAATIVGQALGAKDPQRAEDAVWMAGRMNVWFLGVISVFFMLFAGWIVSLFGADAVTAHHATAGLRIMSAGFIFYAFGMVFEQAFNGAGDPWTPTLLNLCCFWLFEIPLAWLLSHRFGLGVNGAYWSVLLAFSLLAVATAVLFRRGRWKLKQV